MGVLTGNAWSRGNRRAVLDVMTLVGMLVMISAGRPQEAEGVQASAAGVPLTVPRLEAPLSFDGRVDEIAWSGIEPLGMTRYEPVYGGPPSDSTAIRIAHDDNYIYVAGVFLAEDASRIQSNSLARDEFGADDWFRLVLDTYDDNENAVGFLTTPAGVQVDFAVSGDGSSLNYEWNTFWDVVTTRDEHGWYMEMRIPLSSLRFQSTEELATMGFGLSRFVAYRNELSTHPAVEPTLSNAPVRPSLGRGLVLGGVESKAPLYVTPYALSGLARTPRLNESGTAFDHDTDDTFEAGLDLKAGLTSNFTLDATINTDFAQVEADAEQVNLSRFSLFFPEKRQFFLERAGIFGSSIGSFGDFSLFFHSRRIGLTSGGEPLRIYGGARVTGRSGGWDVGVLDMQTEEETLSGSENIAVTSVRRRLLNDRSTVGLMTTSRLGSAGSDHAGAMVDTRLQLLENDVLSASVAATWNETDDAAAIGDAMMARVQWLRPSSLSSQGLTYSAGAKWSGPMFRPALGFQPRSDYSHVHGNVRYGFYPGEDHWLRSLQPSIVGQVFHRNEDGSVETASATGFLNFSLKSGAYGWLTVSHSIEDLRQPLVLSADAAVPAGRYGFNDASLSVFPASGDLFGIALSGTVGQFYDGSRFAFSVEPTWTVSEHLALGAEYILTRLSFDDRDETVNADIGRLRINGALNVHLSGSAFLQYNAQADDAAASVRLRYRFSEGRDLYLVYNERVNTERAGTEPLLPVSQDRRLLVKYTHTFGL